MYDVNGTLINENRNNQYELTLDNMQTLQHNNLSTDNKNTLIKPGLVASNKTAVLKMLDCIKNV